MPSAKFRKLSERQLFASKLINASEVTVEGPDGALFTRDIMHHPGAVVVVPYDEASGEVLFVCQYRAALDADLLELPAGKCDVTDEPADVTAARELAEEIGMEPGRLEAIGRFYTSPGFCDEEIWCFLARDLRPVEAHRHGIEEENMTVERYSFSDAMAMARSGGIKDAKSLVALFLAEPALST